MSTKKAKTSIFESQTLEEKNESIINTEATRWVTVRLIKIVETSNEVMCLVGNFSFCLPNKAYIRMNGPKFGLAPNFAVPKLSRVQVNP